MCDIAEQIKTLKNAYDIKMETSPIQSKLICNRPLESNYWLHFASLIINKIFYKILCNIKIYFNKS